MTDITNHEKRVLREWANENQLRDEETHLAARYILATVDAPPPTLAEELARIAENSPVWTIQNVCDELKSAADRAEQIEHDLAEARAEVERLVGYLHTADHNHAFAVEKWTQMEMERDEARAEVERLTTDLKVSIDRVDRLTAERNRIATGRYVTYAEVDGKPAQKGAESNAETPNPADVKPGEAWIVECRGERRNAVKDRDDDEPWITINADGRFRPAEEESVTLVSRLVPAPRVITNTDELAALPHRTVIRDNAGVMFQRIVHGWYQAGDTSVHRSDDNFVCLPATVLWEPEA